ncbi:uracil-DNA glycosylase [Paenalcaligenes niemegkensis]|uniref:uracil-DNA glycosylase n=1 Tax=Paenalcaligenes niemegkensis TaxID=2895469 RepID=UPI001EE92F19|nr:uracil-DNA glycosylase [Paenalcaligenes niemegkensis]MCQ9616915.1 uracil-DNA glycosylase [Paenalcaligenes niemegkensis]
MIESGSTELQLSAIQRAWLQELGLDRAYLSRITRELDSADRATQPAKDDRVSQPAATAPVSSTGAASSTTVPSGGQPLPAEELPRSSKPASLQEAIDTLRRAANIRPPSSVTMAQAVNPDPASRSERVIPDDLEGLRQSVDTCVSCDLHQSRSRTVFGRGAQAPVQWLVLADAPSDADDKSGVALDGHAGKLLSEMLDSIGLGGEEHSYITQLVKCRPLSSQGPNAVEIEACSAYMLKQIELLQPQYVLALGQLAANQLLGSNDDIEQLRTKVHHWRSPQGRAIPVVVTYHPASLLLRPQHKANAWRDLALVKGLSQSA